MNYEEAMDWLDQIAKKGSRLGLDSVRTLMGELKNPQDKLKFIHIAGTNGKGSVMSYLDQALMRSGFKTGRYLSPVLLCYEEKIQVNGSYIAKEAVAKLLSGIRDAVERIEARGEALPTLFEVETAMAFLYFLEQGCDLVLLETGMGGREDATNIIRTGILELFSSISLDHRQFLGDTIGEIAAVKAGILKAGTLAVSDAQPQEAETALLQEAKGLGVPLYFVEPSNIQREEDTLYEQCFSYTCAGPRGSQFDHVRLHLAGEHQLRNAALALEAVDALRSLGCVIPDEAVLEGFERTRWPGRLEVIHQRPLVVLDGAHNPDAAYHLRRNIDRYFAGRRIYYIFGVFSDKEYDKIIAIMADRAQRIYTVQAKDNPRALDAGALARILRKSHPDVVCVGEVDKALDRAMREAGPEDVILLFGSLAWLGEARACL